MQTTTSPLFLIGITTCGILDPLLRSQCLSFTINLFFFVFFCLCKAVKAYLFSKFYCFLYKIRKRLLCCECCVFKRFLWASWVLLCLLPNELFLCSSSRISVKISVQSEHKTDRRSVKLLLRYSTVWIKWHFEAVWNNFISWREPSTDGSERRRKEFRKRESQKELDYIWALGREEIKPNCAADAG